MGHISLNDGKDFLEYRDGSGRTIEITDIAVTTERRTGIGSRLIHELIDRSKRANVNLIWAITRAENLIAQEFYEALGFRVVGVLRNFYQDEGQARNCVDAIMYGYDLHRY